MKKLLLLFYFLSLNLMANELPELGSYTDNIFSSADEDKISKQILYQVNKNPLVVKDSEIDELIGLRLGADDYVRKPFSQKLLIERIKSILRRNSIKPTNNTSETSDSLKHLAINNETMTCRWRGNKIDLTVTEFSILKSLLSRPGIIKSRDDLINESFKETLKKEDRAIDSHIKRIRKKFLFFDSDFDIIKTIYGIGYKIK